MLYILNTNDKKLDKRPNQYCVVVFNVWLTGPKGSAVGGVAGILNGIKIKWMDGRGIV
jgi:hypothetical protein